MGEKIKNKLITKKKIKSLGIDFVFIFLGCCVGAFATVGILIPNGLTSGGITGIVRIVQNYVGLDFSIMYYIGSCIILIFCAILLGLKEARKIVLLTIMYPAILFVFERLNFQLLEEKDMFLAAIYCGVFSGLCSGMVISRGYSFGGTDTVAKIIKKKFLPHIDLSKILMVIDAIIIVASGVIYGRNTALYALVTTIVVSKVMEMVMFGFETKIVKVEVISDKCHEVANYIMDDLERGVTYDEISGAYTGNRRHRVVALCSPRESVLIRQFVCDVDQNALFTVMRVDTVWGNGQGFKNIGKE